MKRSHLFLPAVAASLALSAGIPLSACAQSATAPDAAIVPASTIDDAKLEQFASAYLAVQAIQKEAAAQQSAATDPNTAQQKQGELQGKMTEAVQKSGLQVNEFNEIAQAMVSDVDLRQRVIAKVQQRANNARSEPTPGG